MNCSHNNKTKGSFFYCNEIKYAKCHNCNEITSVIIDGVEFVRKSIISKQVSGIIDDTKIALKNVQEYIKLENAA